MEGEEDALYLYCYMAQFQKSALREWWRPWELEQEAVLLAKDANKNSPAVCKIHQRVLTPTKKIIKIGGTSG